jgi:enoyl-CoA hydratase/carnithine racemase
MDIAAEIIFSAKIMDSVQAKEAGLLTSLAENCMDGAMALAQNIATKSPDAIKAAKNLYKKAWAPDAAELLKYEALLQRELLGSPNQIEAVSANLDRRKPLFR